MKKRSLFILFFLSTILCYGQILSTSNQVIVSSERNPASLNIPFFEDWSSASLETNNWSTECDNWAINYQTGNENPSVEFTWDPQLQDGYSCSLVSDVFNGETIGVGKLMFDFDIKLDNRTATGDEKLSVEVFDGLGWNEVALFMNESSIDWTSNSIDITEFALNKNFQIRFNTIGQNSFHILSWFIDNISLYRICEAPNNLIGYAIWEPPNSALIKLEWEAPISSINEEFHSLYWGNNDLGGSVGLDNGGDFSAAMKWNSTHLENYIGDTLKEIWFYVNNLGFEEIIVNVWTGDLPQNMIYANILGEQIVNGWNFHELDTLIIIEEQTTYFVGYTFIGQIPSYYPAAYDEGPAIPGYGDLFYLEDTGWGNLSEAGFNNNWMIQMKLANNNFLDSITCIGFNVYKRLLFDESDIGLFDFVPFEAYEEDYSITDIYDEYSSPCYKVTALWALSNDTCESDFAQAKYLIGDSICFFAVSVHSSSSLLSQLNTFPNPFNNSVNFEYDLKQPSTVQITIYSHLGKLVDLIQQNQFQGKQQVTWDASDQAPGMYYFRLESGDQVASGKLLLAR